MLVLSVLDHAPASISCEQGRRTLINRRTASVDALAYPTLDLDSLNPLSGGPVYTPLGPNHLVVMRETFVCDYRSAYNYPDMVTSL